MLVLNERKTSTSSQEESVLEKMPSINQMDLKDNKGRHTRRSSHDSSSSKQSDLTDLTDSTWQASNRSKILTSEISDESRPEHIPKKTLEILEEKPSAQSQPSQRSASNKHLTSLSNLLMAKDSQISVNKCSDDNQSVAGSSVSSGRSILREGKYSTLSTKKRNDATGHDNGRVTTTSSKKTSTPQINLNPLHSKAKELIEEERFMSDPTVHRRNNLRTKPANKISRDTSSPSIVDIDSARSSLSHRKGSDSVDGSILQLETSKTINSNETSRRTSYHNGGTSPSGRHSDSHIDSSRTLTKMFPENSREQHTTKPNDLDTAVKDSVSQDTNPPSQRRHADHEHFTNELVQQEEYTRTRSDPSMHAQSNLVKQQDGISFDGHKSAPNLGSTDFLLNLEMNKAQHQLLKEENQKELVGNYQSHLLHARDRRHQNVSPACSDKDTINTTQFMQQEEYTRRESDPAVYAKNNRMGKRDIVPFSGHSSLPNLGLEDFQLKNEARGAYYQVSKRGMLPIISSQTNSQPFNTTQFMQQEEYTRRESDPAVYAKNSRMGKRDIVPCSGHNSLPNLGLEDFQLKNEARGAFHQVSKRDMLPIISSQTNSQLFTSNQDIVVQRVHNDNSDCIERQRVHAAEACSQLPNRLESTMPKCSQIVAHRQKSDKNVPSLQLPKQQSVSNISPSASLPNLQVQRQNSFRNSRLSDNGVESLPSPLPPNHQIPEKQQGQLFRRCQNSNSTPKVTRPATQLGRKSCSKKTQTISDQSARPRNLPHRQQMVHNQQRSGSPTFEDNHNFNRPKQHLPQGVESASIHKKEVAIPMHKESIKHAYSTEKEQNHSHHQQALPAKYKTTQDSHNLAMRSGYDKQRIRKSDLQQRQQHHRDHQQPQEQNVAFLPAAKTPVKQKSVLQKFFGGTRNKPKQPPPEAQHDESTQSLHPAHQEAYNQRLAMAQAAFDAIAQKDEIIPNWERL